MSIFEHFKAGFYLIIVVIIAVYGLNHSFYGLLVSFQNASLFEMNLNEIDNDQLLKNRYINIKEANSAVDPLLFIDELGKPVKYIYALTSLTDSNQIKNQVLNSKILIESETEITDWKEAEVIGLLKPYWENIDEEILNGFKFSNVKISDDAEYLKLNTQPWNWYWHVLIIALAALFFYRMFEAVVKKVK